jgi:hypothetical protein
MNGSQIRFDKADIDVLSFATLRIFVYLSSPYISKKVVD